MTLKITESDTVDVHYTSQRSNLSNATVLQLPRGEGDLMQIEHKGAVYAINPYHPSFLYLYKRPKEDTNET